MAKLDLLTDGKSDAPWTLILAHGAGQSMHSEFMDHIGGALAAVDLRVIRFEFPYMVEMGRTGKRRAPDGEAVLRETWNGVVDAVLADGVDPDRLLVGGKSMGGRMASLIADDRGVAGLVCLGYPFHPPGRPERLRIAHLQHLRTPTLICQGTRDPFGRREEVEGYPLSRAIRVAWIEDGEHSFKPRKQSGRTWRQNLDQAAVSILRFVQALDGEDGE